MRQISLKSEFVEQIPDELDEGVIYISAKYGTVIHLCCCGCRTQVVTPISLGEWDLIVWEGLVTLHPSIGNMRLECQSHYWITHGSVQWCS